MADAMGTWTAGDLAEVIRSRKISSRELLDLLLQRIDAINPSVNAVVTLDTDRAMETARAADEMTARGESLGPLHGLPVTVKDAIEVGGVRSTGGSNALSDHLPDVDAPAVARLRQAGAVVFGKTNVPEWSGDVQTFNDLFGTTNNPWDLTRTPGGSSGGAAAAVSCGLTSFEIGTDIGGSVRIPSGFCGVYGHKPSFGIVSQRGYLDHVGGGVINADINVFGPIARSAEDLDLILSVVAGPDQEDGAAWKLELPPPRHADVADYRVGLWLDDPACEVGSDVLELLRTAAVALSEAGAHVSESRPPLELNEVRQLFDRLIVAAISVSTPPEVGETISGSHLAWLHNHQARTLMRRVWAAWFEHYDALLCPVTPMPAFPHDHHGSIQDRSVIINGRERNQVEALAWTGLIGVAYLPSTVVPVGRTGEGLPVGVQVVGPYLEDRTSLFLAARLGEMTGGYQPPPVA
jgi:amidase